MFHPLPIFCEVPTSLFSLLIIFTVPDIHQGSSVSAANKNTRIPIFQGEREDNLARRMSSLGVTVDDHNAPQKFDSGEKEVRLVTALLRQELDGGQIETRYESKPRPVHAKGHAKKFRKASRKGMERIKGFANFCFPSV